MDILAIEAPITLTCDAVKLASVVEETLGAVARDTGAHPGHLVVHAGLVLNTPRDVSPGSVLLRTKFKNRDGWLSREMGLALWVRI